MVHASVYSLWKIQFSHMYTECRHGIMFILVVIAPQVDMQLTLALCGVLLVVLAVSSSLGLLSYLDLPANLLVLRVMPLLVLAVGMDNLFFLVHSYEVRVCAVVEYMQI